MDEKLEANKFLLMLGQVAYDIEDNLPPLVIFKGETMRETSLAHHIPSGTHNEN